MIYLRRAWFDVTGCSSGQGRGEEEWGSAVCCVDSHADLYRNAVNYRVACACTPAGVPLLFAVFRAKACYFLCFRGQGGRLGCLLTFFDVKFRGGRMVHFQRRVSRDQACHAVPPTILRGKKQKVDGRAVRV